MKKTLLWVGAVVAVTVVLLLFRKHEPPLLAFTPVRRQTVISNLPTNGKVEPLEWEAVRSEASGLISSVVVKEGQSLTKGAPIARISQPGVSEALEGAAARAAQYRSELGTLKRGGKTSLIAELDASIAKAQFDRDVADHDFHTLQRLVEKQAATNFEVQTAKQRLDAANLAIRTLTDRRTALVSANDVLSGKARVDEAESEVRSAQGKLAIGMVRAPTSGIVYSLPARPGTYVNPGDLIANVGNLDQVRVKVFIDEPELGRIRVGLPVKITWDGLPNRAWEGSVERMPTEIVSLGSRQVGEVWVTIPNLQHDLVPGTTVNAEVRTDVAQNALVVPKSALRRDRGPVGVFALRAGKLTWQRVVTGTSDVANIVVRQGLKDGELVLLPTDASVREGDRVRALVQ